MKNTFNENILTFFPEGRIDGNNVADVEKELFEIAEGCGSVPGKLIFDFSGLG